MPERVVSPIAEPVVDTVWDVENKLLEFIESVTPDVSESFPGAGRVSASAFELVRKIFDFQRDVSKTVIDSVDETFGGIADTAQDVADTFQTDAEPKKSAWTRN